VIAGVVGGVVAAIIVVVVAFVGIAAWATGGNDNGKARREAQNLHDHARVRYDGGAIRHLCAQPNDPPIGD